MGFESLLNEEYIKKYEKYWPNKTILDYLNAAVEKYPNKVAIIDKKSRYTYKELSQLVDRVALGFHALGIRKGDVISLQLPNWNEFVILHLAATRIGAITNPIVPIFRDREVGYMLSMAESKILVIPDVFRNYDYTEMVNRNWEKWPNLQQVFVIGDKVLEKMKPISYLIDEPWEEKVDTVVLNQVEIDPNDVTEIIFTSGTTGDPKGVLHTHNTLCVSANYWIDRLQLTSDDCMFMPSTFGHQTGFGYGVRLPFHIAGTAVYQDIWNPNEFVELIKKEKVTFTAAATPFLQDFVQLDGIENENISSFRVFVSPGAPIPRALVREAQRKLSFKILAGWGQSENGLVTLTFLNDSEDKLTGTDGYPFPGMELKIVDENDNPCPPNTEGSLLCRGPAQFIGYLKRMDLTKKEHTEDGWFRTGDRAVMDEDGYIRITGRDKDIIIRGGENIPVSYVENVLYEHPDIAVAQIVAMPDKRLQEKACTFISMKPGKQAITFKEMQQFLETKGVAKQYWPEHLEIVEDFPRTASGKIQKFKLREMIREKMEQKSGGR